MLILGLLFAMMGGSNEAISHDEFLVASWKA